MTSTYKECLISIHLSECSPRRGGDGLLAGAASAPGHIVPTPAPSAAAPNPLRLTLIHSVNIWTVVPLRRFHQRQPSRWLGRQDVGIADWLWYTAVSHRASSIHRRSTIEDRIVIAPARRRNSDRSRSAFRAAPERALWQLSYSFLGRPWDESAEYNFYLYHTRRCSRRVRPAVYVRDETIRKHERMANEEVLGARKTMFVLVIVVGCFALLWPRILAPLMLGQGQQLKPNQFDRDAGNGGIYNSKLNVNTAGRRGDRCRFGRFTRFKFNYTSFSAENRHFYYGWMALY